MLKDKILQVIFNIKGNDGNDGYIGNSMAKCYFFTDFFLKNYESSKNLEIIILYTT